MDHSEVAWIYRLLGGEGRGGEGGEFQGCARDFVYVIARWEMHHGTVLGDANKKPVMHCQRHYSQASMK